MALTSSEVLASLDGVSSPEGLPLPKTGVLSDILVADGKVFFSIAVNAAVVQAWEPVRKRAEAAVKAIPGVVSVMVALTAERKRGRRRPGRAVHIAHATARQSGRRAGAGPDQHPGGRRHHRRRLRQGRCGQVDDRRQSRARPARPRSQDRRSRCRHLRSVDAEAARHQGTPADPRRQDPHSHGRLRPQGDVDRLPDRGRNADDLARPDGDVGLDADAARGGLGRTRHHGGRHAARHRRRPAHDGAAGAAQGRRHRLDAPGPRLDRCPPRHRPCSTASTSPCSASSRT